jgi:hypothetical protein
MEAVIVKEYKARTKDETKTNHWTLHARKYTLYKPTIIEKMLKLLEKKTNNDMLIIPK